jgi:hypothetical protein
MARVRIPAGNTYSNRSSSSGITAGQSAIAGFAIVGNTVVGAVGNIGKDARLVNCLIELQTDPLSNSAKAYLVKRPGWATATTPQSGSVGNDLLVWTGQGSGTKVISAFGATNSSIYDGTTRLTTNAGVTTAITGKCTGLSETFVTTTPTIAITSSDSTAWSYADGGTVTKIADADFPGNNGYTLAGTFVHMDGYACVMTTDGKLWASDLNTLTGWTATSFDSANAYPDRGIGAYRHRNEIMCFGTESVQFFYNAGLTPFPFAKNITATQKIGAISSTAIGQISDTIFWVGSTPQGGLSVYQYDNGLSRISTPDIDAQLILSGTSLISLTTVRFYGRSFVLVVLQGQTFAYCLEDKAWHEWFGEKTLWHKIVGVSIGSSLVNYAISTVETSGKVYSMSPISLVFSDDGVAYTARAQTAYMDFGSFARKTFSELDVIGDLEETSSTLTISYTDDDYQTFKIAGTVDMSSSIRRVRRMGMSRKRAFSLSHSDASQFRIEALELSVEAGTS